MSRPQPRGSKRSAAVAGGLAAVAAAVVVGLVLAGVLIGSDIGSSPLLANAVGIRAGGCSLVDGIGSGVIVDEGVVMTSAHVVAGANDVRVVVGEQELTATVDVFEPNADLALLHVDGDIGLNRAPVRIEAAVIGSEVVILAWTSEGGVEAIPSTVAGRLLVAIEDIYLQGRTERQAIELTTRVVHGVSGAGVVDEDGSLVGIVYASSREREAAFALDAPMLEALMATGDGEPSPNGRCL